ncbi:MAG: DUF4390 domain-containing protein [Deltaproteobacteria bacterium]|nr:DUF4390 domain-containing protein [Deltaproteobacteria bacterium]
MDDVKVSTAPSLNISFIVKDAFTDDIEEAIKSGIPTSFTFISKLYRIRGFWLDSDMGTWVFRHTVKYDTLKEEYEIIMEEKGVNSIRTKDFSEVKILMTTVEAVLLTPAPALEQGRDYELRLMAELDTINLPFFLDYMLFFVKFWDFETDWFSYRFSY